MTGKEIAEKMLIDHGASQCEVIYGAACQYNPFTNTITLVAIEKSKEIMIANAAHEVAHAVQYSQKPKEILLNAVLRNLPLVNKLCKLWTLRLENEANDIAKKWLWKSREDLGTHDKHWIFDNYFAGTIKLYA